MAKSQRLKLSTKLKACMPADMQHHVYFQPGPDEEIEFPCIVYELDEMAFKYADNAPYNKTDRYQVTYMDHDPDSDVPDKLAALPLSSFSRRFAASGLNHSVFAIYQ